MYGPFLLASPKISCVRIQLAGFFAGLYLMSVGAAAADCAASGLQGDEYCLRNPEGSESQVLNLDPTDPAITFFGTVVCHRPEEAQKGYCPAPERVVDSVQMTRIFDVGTGPFSVGLTIELGRLRTKGSNDNVYMRPGYYSSLSLQRQRVKERRQANGIFAYAPNIWGPAEGLVSNKSTPRFLFSASHLTDPNPDILWFCRPGIITKFRCQSIIEDFAPLYVRYTVNSPGGHSDRNTLPVTGWIALHHDVTAWVTSIITD